MRYEVRFIVDHEERIETVDVDTAAEAAEKVREAYPDPDQHFELIQVHLMDEFTPDEPEPVTEA